jgi:small subunit ribosomal protein S3e
MLDHDPEGKFGPKKPLPDNVVILDPKAEDSSYHNIVPKSEEVNKPSAPVPTPAQVSEDIM